MGRLPLQLPRPREPAGAPVQRQDAGHARGRARRRPVDVLQRPCRACRQDRVQALHRPAAAHQVGRLFQRAVRGPKQVLRYSPVTPTVSPSRTAASSQPTTPASPSAGRIIASTGRAAGRHAASPHEFIRRLLLHVLPKGFHRIRHYGLSPTPTAPRPSRPPARCSASTRLPPIRNSSRISCPLRHACSLAHAPAAATA